jgi:hypothetical protein
MRLPCHDTPSCKTGYADLFPQWPIGMGFDHFYGFVDDDDDDAIVNKN